MTKEIYQKRTTATIAFGAIGGFVSALVMSYLFVMTAEAAGMPASTIPTALGLILGASNAENAMVLGLAIHLVTGTIIGVIFGAVTAYAKKLRITGYGKGIAEGIVAGIISLVVLFLPISMAAMPPVLMNMMMQMNPGMNQQQLAAAMQQAAPTMTGLSILSHIIFGAILGGITSVLVLRKRSG